MNANRWENAYSWFYDLLDVESLRCEIEDEEDLAICDELMENDPIPKEELNDAQREFLEKYYEEIESEHNFQYESETDD
jgi:hypothetical protein